MRPVPSLQNLAVDEPLQAHSDPAAPSGNPSGPWIAAAVIALSLLVLFRSGLSQMVFSEWLSPEYNHAYFIPVVALYLVWLKAADLGRQAWQPTVAGVGLVLVDRREEQGRDAGAFQVVELLDDAADVASVA